MIGWFNQMVKSLFAAMSLLWWSEVFCNLVEHLITSTTANTQATENPELSDWFQAGLRHLEA